MVSCVLYHGRALWNEHQIQTRFGGLADALRDVGQEAWRAGTEAVIREREVRYCCALANVRQ